ncbi:mannosyl-glycoprotein endo-beta-N-acetylglucosaminidase [Sphingomonas sp. PP-CE-3G-477]|uniref:glucosaminidase domain-containing protein n=1 Tax=Sphingomonas sp. PP-CE-3G-477 TaxID=2135660 RepID=UPI000D364285|nr:glucosaminidase domain-containing protein [Sphingomonas sp. PP-CE-3G-477]PTQ64502.1 mannosyl-glycoprotein endo-beta-N-acetylglucosaminidase [Sphingomonas sp. PP-CE-3G-477]
MTTLKQIQAKLGLTADGILGPNTLNAIGKALGITSIAPNARIAPDLILGAIEAQRMYGVPASVSLAQWALESGWGKSMPAGSNNPFGMKARANETGPIVTARTREVYTAGPKKGQEYYITTAFRKFADMAEAFGEHAKLVGTAPVYAKARAKLPDVDAYVDALGPIYATDPNYAKLIKSIMKSNDLYQYNEVAA